jgi:hypothetical protein
MKSLRFFTVVPCAFAEREGDASGEQKLLVKLDHVRSFAASSATIVKSCWDTGDDAVEPGQGARAYGSWLSL